MSDIGIAEIPVDEDEQPLPPIQQPARNALLEGPILRTLLWLAWPNIVALSAGTCVVIAETSYIGRLGVESLAAMALVFPFVILTMTMSGGAMGGGVASAIARALGAGDTDRASTLATHALLIGISFGLTFMLLMLIFGPDLLHMLGGRGNVLAYAIGYVQIFFGGAVLPWLMNSLAGILRGTGNMKLPSLMILCSAVCQIVLGGTLGLGLGPDSAIWDAWRRVRIVDRLPDQHIGHGMVPVLRAGASDSQDQGSSDSADNVRRHPQGRRGVVLFAAAVGAHRRHLHSHAGAVWNRGSGRLRHWRAAGVHADFDCLRGRDRFGADGWHGDRGRSRGASATNCTGRRVRCVRIGRGGRYGHRILPGSLGRHFHPRPRRAAPRAASIFRRRPRCMRSSACPSRCTFPHRVRRKFWGRCWRKPRVLYSWRLADGGFRRTMLRRRTSLRWRRHRWWCSGCSRPRASC